MSNIKSNSESLQSILQAINDLPQASSGTDTSDATALAEDIMKDKTAYGASGKITGNFTITEEITSQETIIENIKNALKNKSAATPILQSKTVTPSANQQTINPDSGYNGLSSVIINGDSDLTAKNIKSGINIFGVIGNCNEAKLEETIIDENGTYYPSNGNNGFSKVTVNVSSSGGGTSGIEYVPVTVACGSPVSMALIICMTEDGVTTETVEGLVPLEVNVQKNSLFAISDPNGESYTGDDNINGIARGYTLELYEVCGPGTIQGQGI